MAQQRPFHQMLSDTTYTKIFVGGLAWETQRDTMRRYFEQFGEIYEAVVITDKHTGKSKGYGFVTFKDPDAASRACQNPSPVIDGRRANCNLAILGATKPYPQFPPPHPNHGGVVARFRPVPGLVLPQPAYHHASSSNPVPHSPAQFPLPYSSYGYSGYSQTAIYPPPVSYYGGYGSQQYSPYYSSGVLSGQPNMYPNFYPYYGHYHGSQISHAQGYGTQYPPQMLQLQHPYWQQNYNSSAGILALPSNLPPTPTPAPSLSVATRVSTPVTSATNSSITISAPEQNSPT